MQESLAFLKPQFKEWTTDRCKEWLYAIHNFQNTIDATIIAAMKGQGISPTSKKIR